MDPQYDEDDDEEEDKLQELYSITPVITVDEQSDKTEENQYQDLDDEEGDINF